MNENMYVTNDTKTEPEEEPKVNTRRVFFKKKVYDVAISEKDFERVDKLHTEFMLRGNRRVTSMADIRNMFRWWLKEDPNDAERTEFYNSMIEVFNQNSEVNDTQLAGYRAHPSRYKVSPEQRLNYQTTARASK